MARLQNGEQSGEVAERGEVDVLPLRRIRVLLSILLIVPLSWSVWSIASYAAIHPNAPPSELRLHETALICGVLLALLVVPWPRLGLALKKVGWLEFAQVVGVQKKESIETIVAVEGRIERIEQELERARSGEGGIAANVTTSVPSANASAELRHILMMFLQQYGSWYFNPQRIVNWGGKQPGFERLAQYSTALITQELQRLLSQGHVRHKISKLGATLYGGVQSEVSREALSGVQEDV
jgi:hypothetical protein